MRSAEASLKLAKTSYDRLVQLRRTNIATQSELDNAKQQLDSAAAQVDNLKATLQKKSFARLLMAVLVFVRWI